MLYQNYLNHLQITLQTNLLLLINLLKDECIAQNVAKSSDIYDILMSDLKSIKHELPYAHMKLFSEGLAINVAISMYLTKLSKPLTIEDIEFFSEKLKLINNIILDYKNYNNFIVFKIISTLVDFEKMIIRFNKKFTTLELLEDKQRINREQFNKIINEHTKIIYEHAAELLLNPGYTQYDDLQLSIHRFKRHIKTIIANKDYQQEELMHNSNNYLLGQQPGHYLGAIASNKDLQCDCGLSSLLLLFKKVFVSDSSKPTLKRNNSNSSGSSFSSSDTLGSSVDSNGKAGSSNSTSDGLSSDDSSYGNNVKNNHFYKLLRY